MSYIDTNSTMQNIFNSMNHLVTQPDLINKDIYVSDEHPKFNFSKYVNEEHFMHHGSGKSTKKIKSKKVKQIDLFKKDDLIKIAKKMMFH